jgi:hypothetical protein
LSLLLETKEIQVPGSAATSVLPRRRAPEPPMALELGMKTNRASVGRNRKRQRSFFSEEC